MLALSNVLVTFTSSET